MRAALILFILLIASAIPALAEISYAKNEELPPLRISLVQLQGVLDKGASLMRAANGSTSIWREELELRKGGLTVKISGYRLDAGGAKLPEYIDTFQYSASTSERAPINRLELRLHDYSRTLYVEGQSPDQVDAIFSALKDELYSISTPLGGSLVISALHIFGILIFGAATFILFLLWLNSRGLILFASLLISIAVVAGIWLLPISGLFAGFLAVKGDAAFIVRYGPAISFWALVVGVIAIPVSWVQFSFGGRRKIETRASTPKKQARRAK